MNKQTKRNRRNRPKNKTKKYYGGDNKGILDVIGDETSKYTEPIADYTKEKVLRLFGLQSIPKDKVNESSDTTKEVDTQINKASDVAPSVVTDVKDIGSDVVDVFDKGSAAVVGNINDVLRSPEIENSVNEAAQETANIAKNYLKTFNDNLSTPEIKEETKIAIENAADIAGITIDAMDKPINKGIDLLNEAGTKALSGVGEGAVKVLLNTAAAIPLVGVPIAAARDLDAIIEAGSDVVQATSDASTTIANVVKETTENINEELGKKNNQEQENQEQENNNNEEPLSELKQKGGRILNRTNKSIETFENPIKNPIMKAGARKTRRKMFKRKGHSKRVRFAI